MTPRQPDSGTARDKFIHVRVSAYEKAAIEYAAFAAHMTTSEWLRALAARGVQCKS